LNTVHEPKKLQSSHREHRVHRDKADATGFSSVNSVFPDITTSHSTKLSKDASQVAGYVAK